MIRIPLNFEHLTISYFVNNRIENIRTFIIIAGIVVFLILLFLSGSAPNTEALPDVEKDNLWRDFTLTVPGTTLLVMVTRA